MANKKVSQLTSKPSVLTTDLFPIADPSTGQLYKTTISDLGTAIGSGVSSVNGLVGAVVLDTDDIQELVSPTNKWFTDTRARAALSASSPLTYNSGTGAFGIQVANGSQNGYLSSTDWTTFNSKQAALSGTGFVKISGTTISYDNSTYLTTSGAASTYVPYTGATTNLDLGANNLTAKNLFFKTNGDTFKISNPVASGSFGLNIFIGNGGDNVTYTTGDSGSFNTSIGYISLNDITTGYRNTVIGQAAMSGLTSGYFNVAIGDNAGRNFGSSLITTANSSVFIGRLTKASANGNTNEIVIGFEAIGNGSNTVTIGNSSITANYFKGSLNAGSFIKSGGTSSQFLKADGSVDSNTYLTTSSASSTYLPLAGGTLTGALSGTSISLSSSVTTSGVYLTGMTSGSGALYYNSGANRVTVANYNASGIVSFEVNGGSVALTLNSNLSATFASAISATGATLTGALSGTSATFSATIITASPLTIKDTTPYIQWKNTSDVRLGYIQHNASNLVYNADTGVHNFNQGGSFLGNLGIGTTSPTSETGYTSISLNNITYGGLITLKYAGTDVAKFYGDASGARITSEGARVTRFYNNSSETMRITFSGNVGIGTTSPASKLEVIGDSRAGNFGLNTDSSFRGGLYSYKNISGTGSDYGVTIFAEGGTGNGNIYFCPGGSATQRMTITSGGNVLVGTTSDTGYYKLDVNGSARVQGTLIVSQATTTSGSVSVAYNVWTTIFTPTTGEYASYLVYAYSAGNGEDYCTTATVVVNSSSTVLQGYTSSAGLSMRVSGGSVQVLNGSGVTIAVQWKYLKLN